MIQWRLPLLILSLVVTPTILPGIDPTPIEDRFLWLEDDKNPQTVAWLADQHTKAEEYFANTTERAMISARLANIINLDIATSPQFHGDLIFTLARFKDKQLAVLGSVDPQGKFQPIVDPETLSTDNAFSISDYVIQKDGSLVAYGLKKNGLDEEEWRIKDFKTGQELPDRLTKIKFCPPAWSLDGKGLYYFRFENNKHTLYFHCLGSSSGEDKELFAYALKNARCYSLQVCDDRYLKFYVRKGTANENSVILADLVEKSSEGSLKFVELFPEQESKYSYVGYREERLYFITDQGAPHGKIISIDLHNLTEPPRLVFKESQSVIQQAYFVGDRLVISFLTNGYSEIKILDASGQLNSITLPGSGTATLSKVPPSSITDHFFFTYSDFIQPPTLYRCQSSTGILTPFMAPKLSWNTHDYEINRLFYPSNDGVKVPLYVVHKKGLQLNGSNPTLLYAYGGFNISLSPYFSAANLAWLESGGMFALASIRGGGELGEEWHRAGMLHNKQQSFDDFMAAAKFLCDRRYTQRSKLAVHGASNGGLLVGACLTQNQDLFKAAIADVGVFDMLRFHLFTVGMAWTTEYGSPDNPEDFLMLSKYSPYHCVQLGKNYPSTLITTADHDERVSPLHSYKFVAALQEAHIGTNPILLRVHYNTGHGAGKTQSQMIAEATERLMFLNKELNESSGGNQSFIQDLDDFKIFGKEPGNT